MPESLNLQLGPEAEKPQALNPKPNMKPEGPANSSLNRKTEKALNWSFRKQGT